MNSQLKTCAHWFTSTYTSGRVCERLLFSFMMWTFWISTPDADNRRMWPAAWCLHRAVRSCACVQLFAPTEIGHCDVIMNIKGADQGWVSCKGLLKESCKFPRTRGFHAACLQHVFAPVRVVSAHSPDLWELLASRPPSPTGTPQQQNPLFFPPARCEYTNPHRPSPNHWICSPCPSSHGHCIPTHRQYRRQTDHFVCHHSRVVTQTNSFASCTAHSPTHTIGHYLRGRQCWCFSTLNTFLNGRCTTVSEITVTEANFQNTRWNGRKQSTCVRFTVMVQDLYIQANTMFSNKKKKVKRGMWWSNFDKIQWKIHARQSLCWCSTHWWNASLPNKNTDSPLKLVVWMQLAAIILFVGAGGGRKHSCLWLENTFHRHPHCLMCLLDTFFAADNQPGLNPCPPVSTLSHCSAQVPKMFIWTQNAS